MSRRGLLLLLAGLLALAFSNRSSAAGSPLFQPPRSPAVPAVRNKAWCVNPIDAFVLARLEAAGVEPSPPADKLRLLRRVTFDLTGLPPTLDEQDAFLKDHSPGAYEKVVDRLLASPHYGERMATDWLDLVRYAETDGFKADDLRPEAYRYRDYVIRSFNADLPYDRFVRQQLAGDELEPDHADAIVATGFLRLWPDEYNAANLEQRRQEILDDVTDTTGLAFLGMTFGCARCHDHKFDPIPQSDYYRLQAFFAPMRVRDDVPALDGPQRKDYRARLAAWEEATKDIRKEMDSLVAAKCEEARKYALTKFRTEIREAELTPADKRTPYQELIALMAEQQMDRAAKDAATKLPDDQKKRYQELERKLAATEAAPTGCAADGDERERRGPRGAADVPPADRRLAQAEGRGDGRLPGVPRRRRCETCSGRIGHDRPALGPGRMADAEGQSADGPRHGQPPLAAPFRRGRHRHAERLRRDGRCSDAPGAAGLVGRRVRRERLEPQAHAPADGAVSGVPARLARRSRTTRAARKR